MSLLSMENRIEHRVLAGRYRLGGQLGAGGMAEVHCGWDVLLRRFVAVKLFEGGLDSVGGARFDNEVRTLAGLSHPGLVSVYDAGECDGMAFVVLQLVEGPTLRDRLVEGTFTTMQVRVLGARLADALAHVHEHDVVHRDVKPSNILLDRAGAAYLADFGLAGSADAGVAGTKQIAGTSSYLAPEQVSGEQVGPAADVYALGLILLECLTGHREYPDSDGVEGAMARLHRPPEVPRDLPADLALLLRQMTSRSPGHRPTAAECAERFRRRTEPTAAFAVEPETEIVKPVGRSWAKLLIASALVASAVGATWVVAGEVEPPHIPSRTATHVQIDR